MTALIKILVAYFLHSVVAINQINFLMVVGISLMLCLLTLVIVYVKRIKLFLVYAQPIYLLRKRQTPIHLLILRCT